MTGFRSIRVRLTLWYTVALAVLLTLFAVGVYGIVRLRLSEQLVQELNSQYTAIEQSLREEPDSEEPETEELEELERIGLTEAFAIERDGKTFYRSRLWSAELANVDHAVGAGEAERTKAKGFFRVRRGQIDLAGHRYEIAVAVNDADRRATLHSLAVVLAAGLPVTVILAVGGGWWLASRALRPVARITAQAHRIKPDRLSERLPVDNPHDEIGELATVFNEVLARLEDAFARVRSFAADASHELRTPLTALRSVGEAALQDRNNTKNYRDAVGSMLEEVDRLVGVLDNLLVLTRADADRAVVRPAMCDLGTLVREVVELVGVLAEEKGQKLTVDASAGVTVWADATLLRQAVINVLDNAIKFTPAGGRVSVCVSGNPAEGVVEIRDSGPGIAEEHRERIFERFYRVDSTRSTERGSGLGLPIARWAVGVNRGRIKLESEVGVGSTFRIVLPAQEGAKA
jgi:heavy metal sensor kinase